jgi:hypothetical protein
MVSSCANVQSSAAMQEVFSNVSGARLVLYQNSDRLNYEVYVTEPVPITVTLETRDGMTQVISYKCSLPSDIPSDTPCKVSDSLQKPPIGEQSVLKLRIDRTDGVITERSANFTVSEDGSVKFSSR